MVKERDRVVEKEGKEKAESTGNTLRRERGWGNPSAQTESIVTASGCVCQGGFRERKGVCLAAAELLSPMWRKNLGAWVCGGVFRWF
jgi:hypothetical protein